MDNVIETSMKISEIASRLGLEIVTICKYCLKLEKRRFVFQRNNGKNRDFTSEDLHTLSQKKYLIEATNIVVAGHGTSDDTGNEPPSVSVSLVKTMEQGDWTMYNVT